MQNTIYQILNLFLLFVPILIIFLCRKFAPNRFWLGMVLSVVFFPIAHFYIKKGGGYVFVILLNAYLLSFLTENEIVWLAVSIIISAVLMLFRFKLWSIKSIEQVRG